MDVRRKVRRFPFLAFGSSHDLWKTRRETRELNDSTRNRLSETPNPVWRPFPFFSLIIQPPHGAFLDGFHRLGAGILKSKTIITNPSRLHGTHTQPRPRRRFRFLEAAS